MFDPIQASNNIRDEFISYISTSFHLADQEYARQFKEALGKESAVSKGPYLDISDSFESGKSITTLIGENEMSPLFQELEPGVPEGDKEIKLVRGLYKHQEKAIRKINAGKNIVVTTGTGSGKTECFILPIINHLLREKEAGTLNDGVRAILIYPMNALANDQMKRLRLILKQYPDITFGVYNSSTQHEDSAGIAEYGRVFKDKDGRPLKPLKNEAVSRKTMQTRPPHILVTNYAMLEYMMLRPNDDLVFSGAKLRFLVLDEAHMPSLKSKRLEQEEIFIRLTKEQNSLLDYLEEQRVAAIQGAAGTGKTLLAIEKARRLASSGKVLFLCFNQFLRIYLQELKNENPKKYENIEFLNLPQLVCQKLRIPSVEKDDIIQFLENYDAYDWEYKHIIIDEGQDFNDEEIARLYDIALLQEGAFYIFFDKNQFVQGREFPDWLRNSECRLVLNINCRNTFSIADTSGKPIRVEPKVKNKGVKGDMPKFYICDDKAAGLKKLSVLIDQYRNNGYAYNQICILTVKTETTSFLQGVEKVGNHSIKTTRSNSNVLFTTARKFKGLEADAIIMIDADAETFADEESKRLFYVGASRAKHYLDIVFVGGKTELEDMVSKIGDKKYPTPFIGIARSLNVKPMSN